MRIEDLPEFDKEVLMQIAEDENFEEMEIDDVLKAAAAGIRAGENELEHLIQSGLVSDQMMQIVDEIEQELNAEFLDECDETFREAA